MLAHGLDTSNRRLELTHSSPLSRPEREQRGAPRSAACMEDSVFSFRICARRCDLSVKPMGSRPVARLNANCLAQPASFARTVHTAF